METSVLGPGGLWVVSLVFFFATGFAACASAASDQVPAVVASKIEGDVASLLHRFAVPGAAVMVIQKGHVSLVRAFGLRDVGAHLPMRSNSYFEIGSITKQFTAASILQLQEAGKLQIDRPLSDYLPQAPHAAEVTLRQLLAHTSGLHDYLDLPTEDLYRLASQPISYDDLIARVSSLPLDFEPGSRWSYSNTGYLLLGKVIATVSGETYKVYLQRHIFGPLHMTNTFTTAEEPVLSNRAIGYYHVGDKLERAPIIDPGWASAAGFIVAPLRDLAKWDEALSSGQIVSPASYREMTAPFIAPTSGSTDYGLGLFLNPVFGEPRIGHTGGSLGFTTADEYFPRQDVRIIAFTNLGDSAPEAGEALTNLVFADLYPEIAARAEKSAPGETLAITQTVRAAFGELQAGKGYASFDAHLREKLASGIGAKFVKSIGSYGAPTAAIFKGVRQDANGTWHDYLMQFGPGVSLPFAVKIGPDRAIASFSVG
jgi:CubicO group peptidase (beta-lactamase class C family)